MPPPGPKILIIDDDPFISDMYVLKFKDEQFDVATARNGREGLEKAESFDPDVILLDVVIPGMDGFEVLEALRKKDGIRAKIILLTNLGQKEDVERGMGLGAADYIVKAHFSPSEVVAKVREVLGTP